MGDEARKFFRYVLPGLVYLILTVALLLFVLSPPELTWNALRDYGKDHDVGAAATVFLVSGGIGYIFASIHHWIHWQSWLDEPPLDHRKIALALEGRGRIELEPKDRELIESTDKKNQIEGRRLAQIATMSFWYKCYEDKHPGKVGIDHLGNQAHGFGTTRISVVAAPLTALWIAHQQQTFPCLASCETWAKLAIVAFITLMLLALFHSAFLRVASFAHEPFRKLLEESPVGSRRELR